LIGMLEASPAEAGTTGGGQPICRRDDVVRLFGTPDETVGSVNEPRLQVEHGIEFNEKWVYHRPRNEPTRPRARVIYWQRYDFVASLRIEQDGHLVRESTTDLLQRPACHA
jgi:hypothetical protein